MDATPAFSRRWPLSSAPAGLPGVMPPSGAMLTAARIGRARTGATVTCGRYPSCSRSPRAHRLLSAGGRQRQCSGPRRIQRRTPPRMAAAPGVAIRPCLFGYVARPRRAGLATRACGQMAFSHDRKYRLTCADCLLCLYCLVSLNNLYRLNNIFINSTSRESHRSTH